MANEQPSQENEGRDPHGTAWWIAKPRQLIRRITPRSGQRSAQNLAIVGLVTVAVIGLGVGLSALSPSEETSEAPPSTLEAALAELDAGNYERARLYASELRIHGQLSDEETGGAAYVLGIVMARDADEHASEGERRILYMLAGRYLQEARQGGFPAGREGYGDFQLGRCLHHGGLFGESLPALQNALTSHPEETREIHRLLASAYYRDSVPQRRKALEFSQLYLDGGPLTPKEQDAALLMHGRLQFELGEIAGCHVSLAQISEDSPQISDAMLLEGRLLMREADALAGSLAAGDEQGGVQKAIEKYQEAGQAFLEAQARSPHNSSVIRQSNYLLGLCYARQEKYPEALDHFYRTSHSSFDTPEGLAAGLEEAHVQHLMGNEDDSLAAYRRVIRQAADMKVYSNPWVPLDEFQIRVELVYDDYLKENAFTRAIDLAAALAAILPDDRAMLLQAEAVKKRAEYLEAQAAEATGPEVATFHRDAKTAWRKAGRLYGELAKLHYTTRQYPEDLWQSAECSLQGHDYQRAVRLLRSYLRNQNRRNRPPALTALGRSLMATNRPEEALLPLIECITLHPSDPFAYEARLIAAQAHLELDRPEQAKELLFGNLEDGELTPRSVEWRESLYALGRIFHQNGLQYETQARLQGVNNVDPVERKQALLLLEQASASFQEAIGRLSEAVRRDEDDARDRFAPESLEARYLTADAWRRSAQLPRKKLSAVTIETTQKSLNREIARNLTEAEKRYHELQNLLNTKQEAVGLSDLESRILRNCYFARADALYDLQHYEEAIQAYSTATNRYQHEPVSLEAYVQIANCHRQMNRPAEARGTLEQAKVVLGRIRPEADFTQTTRYDREQWTQLLDWLSTL